MRLEASGSGKRWWSFINECLQVVGLLRTWKSAGARLFDACTTGRRALQHLDAAFVSSGSIAPHRAPRDARGMFASPPTASELWHRSERRDVPISDIAAFIRLPRWRGRAAGTGRVAACRIGQRRRHSGPLSLRSIFRIFVLRGSGSGQSVAE
jgi:hypothetical protein